MKIRIFDFDWTITREHTFNRTHFYEPQTNIKKGIEALFLHDANHVAAIASYHNNPDYIKSYVEFILGSKLTLKERIDNDDDNVLSVYTFESLRRPIVISTVRNENFNRHVARLKQTGKNVQIDHLLHYLATAENINEQIEVEFYDDDENNYCMAWKTARNFALTAFYVDRTNEQEVVIKESRQAGLLLQEKRVLVEEMTTTLEEQEESNAPSFSS